jgi:putative membrane protein
MRKVRASRGVMEDEVRIGWLVVWAVASAVTLPAWAATAKVPMFAASSAAERNKPSSPAQRLERRFLQISVANMRFEGEGSRLALQRSNNPAVKDLANSLLARQQTAQPELLRLLHVRGMAPPLLTPQHGKVLKQLGRLSGAKFDRIYVDEVVKSCQADVANYDRVGQEAEDPVLKAWVERQLPTLRSHLAKAGKTLPAASLKGQRAV